MPRRTSNLFNLYHLYKDGMLITSMYTGLKGFEKAMDTAPPTN